jgi:hypothetical protein
MRETQKWSLRTVDSARASKIGPELFAKLQKAARISGYRFCEKEGGDLHRWRFLARLAIALVGT